MRILAHPGDLIAPSCVFTSPAAGNVADTITISVNATDNYGVAGVQFKIDGANIGAEDTSPPFSTTLDTHMYANGGHTLTAVARDAKGNSTTVNRSINVANSPPAAGFVFWGDLMQPDGEGGWTSYRSGAANYGDRYSTLILNATSWWGGPGQGAGALPVLNLPGNPDSTHYQMHIQMWAGRLEGGSEHNVVRMSLVWYGSEYEMFNQQITVYNGLVGPVFDANGGEPMQWLRWANDPGWNDGFTQDIRIYYYFTPKYAS